MCLTALFYLSFTKIRTSFPKKWPEFSENPTLKGRTTGPTHHRYSTMTMMGMQARSVYVIWARLYILTSKMDTPGSLNS